MTVLTLVVGALGGGLLATVVGEWLRNRREFEEARLLIIAELLTMIQLARNVASGALDRDWFAAAGIHTDAWLTYRVRVIRRLAEDPGHGQVDGLYATLDLFRREPAKADIQGLISTLENCCRGA
jgi:hypothetical protein